MAVQERTFKLMHGRGLTSSNMLSLCDTEVFILNGEGSSMTSRSSTLLCEGLKWHKPAQVHNLTIRAKGKLLLESTMLTVAAGRRYGLVGPNGKGKSTLLRMIARRQVPVPEGLDVLLVEQVWDHTN